MRHLISLIIFSAFFAAVITPYPISAWAQEAENPDNKTTIETKETTNDSTDPVKRLAKNTDELLSGMDEEELKFIYATRMRDGIIRAVKYIQGMVSGAAEACETAQPDMQDALEERYQRWWEVLSPLLAQAEAHLNKTIENQDLIEPDKIHKHLEMVKEAAEYTRGKIEKKYVTDREACQYLLENMDVTEENLSRQLRETLSSIPVPEGKNLPSGENPSNGQE